MTNLARCFNKTTALVCALALFYAAPLYCAKITPTILYEFGQDGYLDGDQPVGALVAGSGGVIYGVTEFGGIYGTQGGGLGYGTAYSLTPPASPGGIWTQQVIWSFGGPGDGVEPVGIALGPAGVFYGVTGLGGSLGKGTVFTLTPPALAGGQWSEQVIWNFGGAGDGSTPLAGVAVATGGTLYGTTSGGGASGNGTVFSISPPQDEGGAWTENILWSFAGGTADGTYPQNGLTLARNGNLYGDTSFGGAHNFGVVFELVPPVPPATAWSESILRSFVAGYGTIGPLTLHGGALFGVTALGFGSTGHSAGEFFSLHPPKPGDLGWRYKALYDFPKDRKRDPQGGGVNGPLLFLQSGGVVGTAEVGGPSNAGTIFQLNPPAAGAQQWTAEVLCDFGSPTGALPDAGLTESGGVAYGATAGGGSHGHGNVYSVVP